MTEMTEKDLSDNSFEAKSITRDEHGYDNRRVGKNEEETNRGKRDSLSCLWGSMVETRHAFWVLRLGVFQGSREAIVELTTLQSVLMNIFKCIEIFR